MIGGLAWERPAGLALLVLPALLLLLVRRRRPPARAVGTLDVWREVAQPGATRGARGRARPSLSTLLVALGLALGALALAGPRRARPAGARTWRVVVDRSPSMYLPAQGGASTRLRGALERAEALLAEVREAGDGVEWVDGSRGPAAQQGQWPEEWSRAPRAPLPGPRWSSFDAAGVLWVTDEAPDPEPRLAGYAASGGQAVPGAVAVEDDGTLLLWDGAAQSTTEGPRAARGVSLGSGLPPPVIDLARAWAGARGLTEAPASGVHLVVECSRCGGAVESASAGRDGWSASGEALAAGADLAGAEAWLAAGELALVTWRPGRVDLAWPGMSEPRGDPAAFAVSWSELLDRALLLPEGVVAIAERAHAGPARERPPAPPLDGRGGPPDSRSDAWLALAAALAVALGSRLRAA